VAFVKQGDEYLVVMNDDDLPQLRLNPRYRKLLSRNEAEKDVRNYVKERYKSAIQLIKNIEQRKQTILKVCYAIIGRQHEFLDRGIDRAEADDDQGSRRGNRGASLHREPGGGQQIRAYAARGV
jgi:DNA-directed RNA polymerase specialized sigma54-like protein